MLSSASILSSACGTRPQSPVASAGTPEARSLPSGGGGLDLRVKAVPFLSQSTPSKPPSAARTPWSGGRRPTTTAASPPLMSLYGITDVYRRTVLFVRPPQNICCGAQCGFVIPRGQICGSVNRCATLSRWTSGPAMWRRRTSSARL